MTASGCKCNIFPLVYILLKDLKMRNPALVCVKAVQQYSLKHQRTTLQPYVIAAVIQRRSVQVRRRSLPGEMNRRAAMGSDISWSSEPFPITSEFM